MHYMRSEVLDLHVSEVLEMPYNIMQINHTTKVQTQKAPCRISL